ncbi:unnamed protein product [Caenorhabditis brenneri]
MGSLSIWLFYGIPSLSLVVFFMYFLRRPEFKYSFYKVLQCDLMIISLSLPYILLTCDYNVQKTIKKILGFIATSKINSGQVGAMMI